jgi:hypothetical protein
VKKPKSSKTSSGSITGPTLTNAQKVARDLASARKDTTKARAYDQIAAAERTLGHTTTAAHDVAKAKHQLAKAAKEVLKAHQVGWARPGTAADGWLLGGNDQIPACGAAAVANSLLAAINAEEFPQYWRPGGDDVARLHFAAGGTDTAGAALGDVLDVLAGRGLAGFRPRSISAWPVDRPLPAGAVAVVLVPGWAPHAVAIAPAGPVSWGALWPARLLEHAVEAWSIDW